MVRREKGRQAKGCGEKRGSGHEARSEVSEMVKSVNDAASDTCPRLGWWRWLFLGVFVFGGASVWGHPDGGYPRLLGMNIGAKNYGDATYQPQLARLDAVILGFYPGWGQGTGSNPIRQVVQALKRINPKLLVGQYTIVTEAYERTGAKDADRDKTVVLDQQGWWLKTADGRKVQWTDVYGAWDVNITEWTKPDGMRRRYPEWLADRDYKTYFLAVPEFDIWFFDGVSERPYTKVADWTVDRVNDSNADPRIAAAFRRGHAREWSRARSVSSRLTLMGNVDNDLSFTEYAGRLQGAFLEALMGKPWSLESWGGWDKMMARYRGALKNVSSPRIVGFNIWGDPADYRLARYGLTSCLLEDAYFSFTDKVRGYSSVPWFDEYDVNLGKPTEVPQRIAWRDGVYRRLFEKGMILVNPTGQTRTVDLPSGYRRIVGRQDAVTNNGQVAGRVVLPPKDGLVLVRAQQARKGHAAARAVRHVLGAHPVGHVWLETGVGDGRERQECVPPAPGVAGAARPRDRARPDAWGSPPHAWTVPGSCGDGVLVAGSRQSRGSGWWSFVAAPPVCQRALGGPPAVFYRIPLWSSQPPGGDADRNCAGGLGYRGEYPDSC